MKKPKPHKVKTKLKFHKPDQEKRKMPRKNIKALAVAKSASKYRNKKVDYDGITFDSIKEKNRYVELKEMEAKGVIQDLKTQQRFNLYTPKIDMDTLEILGMEKDGWYVADFVYYIEKFNQTVVEDVKGFRTPEYKRKKKRLKIQFNIDILET